MNNASLNIDPKLAVLQGVSPSAPLGLQNPSNCFSPEHALSSENAAFLKEDEMPSFDVVILDSEKRAREKQASREHDEFRLRSGMVSREDLHRENSFFSSLPIHKFRIVAIGGRPIEKLR
jgi:hypothetical protein